MHVLGSECRWGMASSDPPEITEHAYSCTPFQDGVDKNRKGADVEGRLADKTGFVGRIPLSPHLFIQFQCRVGGGSSRPFHSASVMLLTPSPSC